MKSTAILIALSAAFCVGSACVAEEIEPIAMSNKAIGGAELNQYTPGVEGGAGAHNIALLIKTWGKVTWVDTGGQFFYIDDGSGRLDGSTHLELGVNVPNVGIRVTYADLAQGNSIVPPQINDKISVTAISSTYVYNTKIQPLLRPRKQSDLQNM